MFSMWIHSKFSYSLCGNFSNWHSHGMIKIKVVFPLYQLTATKLKAALQQFNAKSSQDTFLEAQVLARILIKNSQLLNLKLLHQRELHNLKISLRKVQL